MKTTLVPVLALTSALALTPASAPLLAQDSQQQDSQQTSGTGDQSQTWQNPDRIADIEDESERIRAFSVLIGQSVYDLMAEAQSAGEGMQDDQATQDDQAPQDDQATQGDQATQTDQAESLSGGLPVTIINISSMLNPADVRSLEALAEQNRPELLALHEVIELDEELRTALEEQDLRPADVVGVQRSSGMLDILVIPGWLDE